MTTAKPQMHAIIIAEFADFSGGAQRVAVESARALAELGVRVTFIHAIEGAVAQLDHPSIERICLGLEDVWTLRAVNAVAAGVWNERAAKALRRALTPYAGATDTMLHLHQWTRALSPSIFPVLREANLPLFVTAHDYFIACPNGVLFRFDLEEPCRLDPMSLRCIATNCDTKSYLHKAVRVMRTAATRQATRSAEINLIHVSDRSRDILVPLVPASWRHYRVDNPVSIAKAQRIENMAGRSFAFIGRLTSEKGAILAAQAAAQTGAPILFIGDGPAKAEISAICPHAEMAGWLPASAVEALLRTRVRAMVAPSLWPETGPLTVYEASAAGLASIVSNRCGASERIGTASGFVIEPNLAEIARSFERLRDDETASQMGHAAYQLYWENPPTAVAHARHLLEIYAAQDAPMSQQREPMDVTQ
jgi:glycosyltransferase involved in cell wall biosynthesis